jgi:hypothetical protein
MKSRDQAAVFAYDGGRWEKIGGDGVRGSWNDRRYTGVYELWPHTDGELYVGLIGRPGPSAVHRYDGSRWEQVAGDGLRDSWRNAGATHPFSFASYQGRLVVSMNRHPLIAGQFSSVWSFDGEAWRPVGVGRIPSAWGRMHNYNALAVYRDHLLIGAGGDPAGYASVWSLDGDGGLRQIGGAGLLGSWDGSDQRARVRRVTSTEYVYRLVEWRDSVIAGFGTGRNMAQLWRLDAPAPPPG